jgi:hypothetical protein
MEKPDGDDRGHERTSIWRLAMLQPETYLRGHHDRVDRPSLRARAVGLLSRAPRWNVSLLAIGGLGR